MAGNSPVLSKLNDTVPHACITMQTAECENCVPFNTKKTYSITMESN